MVWHSGAWHSPKQGGEIRKAGCVDTLNIGSKCGGGGGASVSYHCCWHTSQWMVRTHACMHLLYMHAFTCWHASKALLSLSASSCSFPSPRGHRELFPTSDQTRERQKKKYVYNFHQTKQKNAGTGAGFAALLLFVQVRERARDATRRSRPWGTAQSPLPQTTCSARPSH